MTQLSPARPIHRLRVFSACLLSLLILSAPMAPLAASANRTTTAIAEKQAERKLANLAKKQLSPREALERSLFVNPPAAVVPAVGAPAVISATLTDSFVDVAPSSIPPRADPGSIITYTATITNSGGTAATLVNFTDTISPYTTLLAGTIKVSPLAFADAYNATVNTNLSVSAPGVLGNDTGTATLTVAGITSPVCGVATAPFSCTTAQGGTVSLAADGSFSYDPASGFTGADTFTYTATNGQSPNDTATVTITVAAASNPPTASDDALTVNEDAGATAVSVLANDADPDGGPKNIASFTTPTNGSVVGTGPSGAFTGLTYQPNANYCNNPPGTTLDTFAYTLNGGSVGNVTMTVTCINDAPSFTKGADQTVNEDSGAQTVSGWATLVSPGGGADEAGQTLTFAITNNTNAALFSAVPAVAADGTLTYTPAGNANGSATITLKLQDNGGGTNESATQSFVINVTSINDAPSFTKGPDKTTLEDSGAQTFAGWATAISSGPANESGQTLTFAITNNTNSGLFSAGPSIGPTGTLTYTPATNANGSATITLKITDNGGTTGGGVDESATQTFDINVTAVNDVPSFTKGSDQNVNEDAGPQTAAGWATSISAGPADESTQTLTFAITANTNAGLFSAGPAVAANGDLTYTPAANANGTATITLRISDNGGTANSGFDTSATQTFVIMVGAVNDPPSFTKGVDQTVNEDAVPQSVPGWATAISAGPADEAGQTLTFVITANTNAGLFSAGPAVSSTGTLTYTLVANANGTAAITLKLTDSGGGTNESGTQTFNINVTAVNDAPVVDLNGATGGIDVAATFTEDTPGGIVIAGATDVTDVDNLNLVSATITLTNRPDGNTVESLSVDITGTSIVAAAYVQATGVLALSGSDTKANYQQVLRTVKYNNTSQNPDTTNRTVNFKANDGALDSTTAVATVTVVSVNDAPVLGGVSGGFTYIENDPATAIAPGITVADVDNTTLTSGTVTISANYQSAEDVLSFTPNVPTMGNITASSNTGGVLTLSSAGGTATLAQWAAAFAAVKYSNSSNDPNAALVRTVTFQVDDGQAQNHASNTVSRTITITAVNDAPTANGFTNLPAQAGIPISYPIGKLGGSDVEAGTTITIDTTPINLTNVASVIINANGSFTFTPTPASAVGAASFQYRVYDNGNPNGGPSPSGGVFSPYVTVSFTVAGPAIYFVKASGAGTACTLGAECTLTQALTNIGAATNTTIFMNDAGAYTNSVSLNSNGWLIGPAVTGTTFAALFGIVAPVGGGTLAPLPSLAQPAPTLTASAGQNAVNLTNAATTNSVRGLNLATVSAATKGINGATFGTLTVTDIAISGSGPALDLTTGILVGGFNSITSSGGANGIRLSAINSGSTISFGTGALSGATADEFLITGTNSTIALTYNGTISTSAAGAKPVNISGKTSAGSVTFNGAVSSTGAGVNLDNNDGATITFRGGLALTTTTNTGFNAINGGTIEVCDENPCAPGATGVLVNTITTTTGIALNVTNTTISANKLEFKSITAGTGASGPTEGIILNTTGALGGLIVKGDGNASLGGNSSGGIIQRVTNHGISLTSTINPSFTNMNIHDIGKNGIDGFGVTNFTFANGNVATTGTGSSPGDFDVNSIAFVDRAGADTNTIDGTVSITGSTITDPERNAIYIETWAGTISSLTISNNTLSGGTTNARILTAIGVFSQGSASGTGSITTASIQNNNISDFRFFDTAPAIDVWIGGNGIRVVGGNANAASTSATLGTVANPILITGNDIDNVGSNMIAVTFAGKTGISNFTIQNNGTSGDKMTNAEGNGISVFFGGNGTFNALVDNNWIDNIDQGGNPSGSKGIAVQSDFGLVQNSDVTNSNITVSNNHVSNTSGDGFQATGINNAGTFNLRMVNNAVTTVPDLDARYGIRVQHSNVGTQPTLNLEINGNTTVGAFNAFHVLGSGIGVRKQDPYNFGIEGLSPTPTNSPEAYINSQNPGGAGTDKLAGTGFTAQNVAFYKQENNRREYLAGNETAKKPLRVDATSSSQRVAQPLAQTSTKAASEFAKSSETKRSASQALARHAGIKANAARERTFANHVVSRSAKLRTVADKPITPLSGETVNVNIGVLPAGKSVTITFQVQLNASMPSGTSSVTTQGTVTYSGGSSLIANPDAGTPVLSPDASVLTDDTGVLPNTGETDPTVTPIDAPTATGSSVGGQILDSNGNPVEGAAVRMTGTQNRLTVTDATGFYHFDDVETNGFYTVVPARSNFTFSPSQRAFSQLGQHTDAVFVGNTTGTSLNPLDTTEYFVRQQYVDFLGREPDEAGLGFWVNNIEGCGNDAQCRAGKRTDTSAAFFLSIEFQQTGYLVYRTYQTAFGDMAGAPVPVKLGEFKPDTAAVAKDVIVNATGWETTLDNNKVAFMAEFVTRAKFVSAYPTSLSPSAFVDQLFTHAGVTPADGDRTAAINEFGSATTTADAAARGRALRRVAENTLLQQQEFTQAFVLMQYFGYLRRDPNAGPNTDYSGYTFWLTKLNGFNGNFGDAEMVKSFLVSTEYRGRFPK